MTDFGKSGRKNSYGFYLVEPITLRETGQMVQMEANAGSITWDFESDNKVSASFNIVEPLSREHLIRVKQLTEVDGEQFQTTLGTFFIDKMPQSAKYGLVRRKVNGYSYLWKYTQDSLAADHFWEKGFNCVDAIREIVEWDSGHLSVQPGVDTARGFGQPIFFGVGTNRYKVISDIAGWINCRINVDPDGYILLEPYANPAYISESHTFSPENCTYVAGMELDDLQANAVNRVIAYYSNQDSSDSVTADLPSEHPYSFQRIGRRASMVEQVQETMSHEELVSYAQRKLDENSVWDTTYEIEHVYIPGLCGGKTVRYINDEDYEQAIDAHCLITQMDMQLTPGALCKTKLKVAGK